MAAAKFTTKDPTGLPAPGYVSRQRTFYWSLTYEYDTQAPDTVKGEIVAGSWETAVARAARAARSARPGVQPRSLVVVLEIVPPSTQPPSRIDQ